MNHLKENAIKDRPAVPFYLASVETLIGLEAVVNFKLFAVIPTTSGHIISEISIDDIVLGHLAVDILDYSETSCKVRYTSPNNQEQIFEVDTETVKLLGYMI
jgi:methyl coenzyme M reductase subunit C